MFCPPGTTGAILCVGNFAIRAYGLLLMIGILLGAYLAAAEARRRGENSDHVWDGLLVVFLLGLIGARLYHVFSNPEGAVGWSYYRENPIKILYIWEGGLAIYGALIGGLIGFFLYAYRHRLAVWRWLDITAPSILVGQAIGRWGNFFNQELYGPPTTLPWGIPIPLERRLPQHLTLPPETRFHPVFLYESLWNTLGFLILFNLSRRLGHRLREGDLFALYLIWYPVGRLWIETLRPDAWKLGNIAAAQVFSLIALAAGLAILIRNRLPGRIRGAKAPTEMPETKTPTGMSEV